MSTTNKHAISTDSPMGKPPFNGRAPHLEAHPKYGDVFVMKGLDLPIPP